MNKSWLERYERMKFVAKSKGVPMVCKVGKSETLYIPSPEQVENIIMRVQKGKLTTIQTICEKLAKEHKTTKGCPMTTGQFMVLISNVNEEKKGKTPWWRVLKSDGELHPKYPKNQKKLLEEEGHKIIKKNNKFYVKDYQTKLAR